MAAAGTNLVVKISAVDATSAAIDAVTKKLAGINAPAAKVTKSLARLSDATGVTHLSKAFVNLGGSVATTGERIAETLGGIAPLTAALSMGGMAKMTSDWARFSQHLGFSATRLGVGVSQLDDMHGSAKLAGASAQSVTSGLTSLQDTMTDMVGGRNNEAVVYFRQLGVAFEDGRGHALRATEVMPKLADALKRISDRSLRARVGTALLGGSYEELANWIDRGSEGMRKGAEDARRMGGETEESNRRANEFAESQGRLELAFKKLSNSIAYEVSPAFTGLMNQASDWIAKNREMISINVKGWADDYSKAFGVVGGAVDKVVTSTIGWNRALEFGIPLLASRSIPLLAKLENAMLKLALVQAPVWLLRLLGSGPGVAASIMLDSSPTNVGEENTPGYADRFGKKDPNHLSSVDSDKTAQRMMAFFESREGGGFTHAQAAGIAGNFFRESSFDPNASKGQYYGLAQWGPDRQRRFKEWSGHDIHGSSLDEQMRFVAYELSHQEKAAGDILHTAPNAGTAGLVMNSKYERPLDVNGEGAIRADYAKRFDAMPSVKVDVNIAGLPPGSTATTRTSGDAQAGVKIARSMH